MKNFAIILCFVLSVTGLGALAQATKGAVSAAEREQSIQRALEWRRQENYAAAVLVLDSLLAINNSDAPLMLLKGDLMLQSRRFDEAANVYRQLLPLEYETTIARINLSYALFMNHKPAKALEFAQMAWQKDSSNANAVVNYFNALLWNMKTNEASVFLQQQDSLLTKQQQLVLKARLFTTSGNYQEGLRYYDSLVKTYPDKYYVQEYAEVLLGKREVKQSETTMQKAKALFSPSEFKAYQQKLEASKQQNAGTEFMYFKDVAGNVRIESSVWWQQAEEKRFRLRLSGGLSSVSSPGQEKTNAQFGHISITERWNRSLSGESDIHFQFIQPGTSPGFSAVTGRQTLQYQPNDRRMVGAFYSSEILNFTASLLEKNIRSHNAGYVTHLMMNGKTGFFSQGSVGKLTDGNTRYSVFGSVYHLLRTEPTLKGGINFSALHYSDQSSKEYFSPNRYLNAEVFGDFSTPLPKFSKFYLMTQAAAGMQQIEKEALEPSFRFQAELGFRLPHFETALKYQTSNVASNTGTGYSFNWYTFRVLVKW